MNEKTLSLGVVCYTEGVMLILRGRRAANIAMKRTRRADSSLPT